MIGCFRCCMIKNGLLIAKDNEKIENQIKRFNYFLTTFHLNPSAYFICLLILPIRLFSLFAYLKRFKSFFSKIHSGVYNLPLSVSVNSYQGERLRLTGFIRI